MKRFFIQTVTGRNQVVLYGLLIIACLLVTHSWLVSAGQRFWTFENCPGNIGLVLMSFGLIGWQWQRSDVKARAEQSNQNIDETLHELFLLPLWIGTFCVVFFCLMKVFMD